MAENGEKLKLIGIDEVAVAENEGRQAIDFGSNGGEQSSQRADGTVVERRMARKRSFRFCRPQGTFMWPSMGFGTDLSGGGSSGITMEQLLRCGRDPAVEVVITSPLEEQVMLGDYFSTPPSASSTTNASKLLPLPSLRSPLQPQPLLTARFRGKHQRKK